MKRSFLKTVADISLHPRNFPKFASIVILASGILGVGIMKAVERNRDISMKDNHLSYQNESTLVQDMSLVRAMIENAKASTTRENLENAAMAQNNFYIPQESGEKERVFISQLIEKSKRVRDHS